MVMKVTIKLKTVSYVDDSGKERPALKYVDSERNERKRGRKMKFNLEWKMALVQSMSNLGLLDGEGNKRDVISMKSCKILAEDMGFDCHPKDIQKQISRFSRDGSLRFAFKEVMARGGLQPANGQLIKPIAPVSSVIDVKPQRNWSESEEQRLLSRVDDMISGSSINDINKTLAIEFKRSESSIRNRQGVLRARLRQQHPDIQGYEKGDDGKQEAVEQRKAESLTSILAMLVSGYKIRFEIDFIKK